MKLTFCHGKVQLAISCNYLCVGNQAIATLAPWPAAAGNLSWQVSTLQNGCLQTRQEETHAPAMLRNLSCIHHVWGHDCVNILVQCCTYSFSRSDIYFVSQYHQLLHVRSNGAHLVASFVPFLVTNNSTNNILYSHFYTNLLCIINEIFLVFCKFFFYCFNKKFNIAEATNE